MFDYYRMIDALTANYLNVYTVDPIQNTGEIIKLDGYITAGIQEKPKGFVYSDLLRVYCKNRVYEEDQAYFLGSLLSEALIQNFSKDEQELEFGYRVVGEDGKIHYYSAHYIRISKQDESLKLVAGFRNVDTLISQQKKIRKEGLYNAYNAISDIYLDMFRVNVKENTYSVIKVTQAVEPFLESDLFDTNAKKIITLLAHESLLKDALNFSDITTLQERMKDKNHVSMEFLGNVAGWCKLHFIKEDEDEFGNLSHVLFAVEKIDEDKNPGIFDVLARNYKNVYWLNLKSGQAKPLKMEDSVIGVNKDHFQVFSYEDIMKNWVISRVYPDEREATLNALSLKNLRDVFSTQDEYVGTYRVVEKDVLHYYQYNLIKMDNSDYVLLGFQNIDSIVQENLEYQNNLLKAHEATKLALEEKNKHLEIVNTFASLYETTYLVDFKTHEYTEIRSYDLLQSVAGNHGILDDVVDDVIKYCVADEYYTAMKNFLDLDQTAKKLESTDTVFSVYFRPTGYWYEARFIVKSRDLNGKPIEAVYVSRDCTEEKKFELDMQEKLKDKANQAEIANRSKTDFLQRMSHDIRTPINGIRGMLEIAQRYADDLDKQAECREKIRESSDILLELVNEVLDMNKLDSNDVVLEHIPFSIKDIAKEVYLLIENQASERNIEIISNTQVEHKQLLGSPAHVKRLFTNILSNAVKYNKDNGKIFFECKEDPSGIFTFTCRDTGIGMSEEFLEHIYEPFTQENSSSRTKYPGTGLGMSIAKKLVDKMNGTITIETEKGVGTTFTVVLPFEIDVDSTNKNVVSNDDEEEYSIEGLHILLAEDNDLNMEIAEFLLKEKGAIVDCAWDGQEAVDVFEKSSLNEYDVILMDVMMPVMDGHEATRRIRQMDRKDSNVPIIAMTANAFVEDKLKAKEVGMDEHIAKPLDTKLLVKTITKLIKEKENE